MTSPAAIWQWLAEHYQWQNHELTLQQLQQAYGGEGRIYHGIEHIAFCLTHWQQHRQHMQDEAAVALALWFHDAVYDPKASDNEAASARWAVRFLEQQQADASLTETVYALIMATCHQVAPATPDQAWLVDIDLGVLGADAVHYQRYTEQVRQEYACYSDAQYHAGRARVLQGFLDQARIYHSEYFYQRYEQAARRNLQTELSLLPL